MNTTIQADSPKDVLQCAASPVPILSQVRPHTWYNARPPVTATFTCAWARLAVSACSQTAQQALVAGRHLVAQNNEQSCSLTGIRDAELHTMPLSQRSSITQAMLSRGTAYSAAAGSQQRWTNDSCMALPSLAHSLPLMGRTPTMTMS